VTTPTAIATRLALGVIVFVLLAGPTPGAVGSCGEEAVDARAEQFCIDKKYYTCQRENGFGRDPTCEREAIFDNCLGHTFPAGCSPSERQTDACINALQQPSGIPTSAIVECQEATLCAPE